MTTHRVFVYGSLLAGLQNHRHLRAASKVGTDRATGCWRMLDLGSFPGVVPGDAAEGKDGAVTGEVYEVSDETFRRLDRLEGHPRLYRRELVETEANGPAWMYVYQSTPPAAAVVPGNDWRRRVRAGRAGQRK